jgi:hypothetical protein
MRRQTQTERRDPLIEEGDNQSVDLLLRVASGPEHCMNAQRDEVLRLQGEFQPLVQMAIDDPAQLHKQEFSRRLQELAQGGLAIRIGSAIQRSGKSLLMYYRDFRDIHAILSHGVVLLLDDRQLYGKSLCRCRLPRCGRYYLAKRNPKGGPANRSYCMPAHRDEYRDSAIRKAADARKHK